MIQSQSQSLIKTVALFSPNDVNLLAGRYGYYWPSDSPESRVAFLEKFWEDKGDNGIIEIAAIHPDRDLIIEACLKSSHINNADGAPVIETIAQPSPQNTTTILPVVIKNEISYREKLLYMILMTAAIFFFIKYTSK